MGASRRLARAVDAISSGRSTAWWTTVVACALAATFSETVTWQAVSSPGAPEPVRWLLGLGSPALVVLGTAALVRRPPSLRSVLRAWPAWWTLLAVALAAAGTVPSVSDLAWSAVIGRPVTGDLAAIPAGGEISALLAVALVVRRRPTRPIALRAVTALAALAAVVRVVCAAVGADPHGALLGSGLGQLHLVAAGLLVTVLARNTDDIPGIDVVTPLRAAAIGIAVVGPAAAWLFVRQVPERIVADAEPPRIAALPVSALLWAVLVAAAAGVVGLTMATVCGSIRRGHALRCIARLLEQRAAMASVVAAGFLWRVASLFVVAPRKTDLGDPLFYHTTANVIARGGGFWEPNRWIAFGVMRPSAFHGPLYPVVLSLSSRLGGTGYLDHKMVSILLGTATIAAVGALARLVWGRVGAAAAGRTSANAVGVVAAALAAVNPSLWLVDGLLFPEGLMALLVTITLIAAYHWLDRGSLRRAAALGALVALAALARGEGLLLAPLLVAPLMLLRREWTLRRRVGHLGMSALACVAVLAPWTARNILTFEEFVPLSTNGNEVMVYSNCATAYSGTFAGWWDFQCQESFRRDGRGPDEDVLDESQVALFWREIGLDYARANADQLPRVVAMRVLRQWDLARPWQNTELGASEGRDPTSSRIGLGQYYAMAGLGAVGVVALRRRKVPLLPLLAPFFTVTLTAAVTYGTIRFRAPAEPALCVLAAVGAVPALRAARSWFTRRHEHADATDGSAWVVGGRGALVRWSKDALRTWVVLGAVLAVVGAAVPGLLRSTGGNMEEGFMLVFPELMLRGHLPNLDFLHLYGPGSLHALMGWYSLVGTTITTERVAGLLQHLVLLTGLFALARPWGRSVAGGVTLTAVFYVLTPVGLTAMAWNGGIALTVWSLVALLRALQLGAPPRLLIASGILAGLALSYRPDLAVAIVLVHAWAWWRHRRTLPLAVGAAVGLLPTIVHLAMVGPTRVFEGMFLDPVFRLRPGRELPSPPSWGRLDGSLQAVAELVPPWWGLPHLPAPLSLFAWFFVMLAAPIAVLFAGRRLARRCGRNGRERATALTGVGLLAIGIVPQGLQRPDSAHLGWVTCVSVPFLVVAIVESLHHRRPAIGRRQAAVAATAAVAALTLVVAPLFTFRTWLLHVRVGLGQVVAPFVVERDRRRFFLGDLGAARDSQAVLDDLDRLAAPGESIIVGPSDLGLTWYSDVFFYHLLPELEPGTYYIEMDPGLANARGSGLAEEVAGADWVLLTGFWDGWVEPNTSVIPGDPSAMQALTDTHCLVREYPEGLVRLYRRCR